MAWTGRCTRTCTDLHGRSLSQTGPSMHEAAIVANLIEAVEGGGDLTLMSIEIDEEPR